MLMKKFAKEAEKGPVGHSCCDICAKVCRCLFTCGDECTCEELCNSGNLQSPIADTHARWWCAAGFAKVLPFTRPNFTNFVTLYQTKNAQFLISIFCE